jgi:hypothetical protein
VQAIQYPQTDNNPKKSVFVTTSFRTNHEDEKPSSRRFHLLRA